MESPQIMLLPTSLPLPKHPASTPLQPAQLQEPTGGHIRDRLEISHHLSEMEGNAEQSGMWVLNLSVGSYDLRLAITTSLRSAQPRSPAFGAKERGCCGKMGKRGCFCQNVERENVFTNMRWNSFSFYLARCARGVERGLG